MLVLPLLESELVGRAPVGDSCRRNAHPVKATRIVIYDGQAVEICIRRPRQRTPLDLRLIGPVMVSFVVTEDKFLLVRDRPELVDLTRPDQPK
jgi:hypothetical protein